MPLQIDNPDMLVFWLVAAARILVPLTIPLYPLPGIVASLLLDGLDQTIFQQFPGINLARYQGYDKALDIYYLTIAYISTLRNWKNHFAFQISRLLFYWRLVGVVLFELTQLRVLLFIFPNTFEYFFIFYEAYRLRWDPMRLNKQVLVGVAAVIWMVIKLPQEYWLHIAEIDTTDWIKTRLLGIPMTTSWGEILRTWPVVFLIVLIGITLFLAAVWWLIRGRIPPADRTLAFSADAYQPAFAANQVRDAIVDEARQIVDAALLEKLILVTLVSLSFAQVLPNVRASDLQLAGGVSLIVILNTVLSHWMARRGYGWAFTIRQFIVLMAVNALVMLIYTILRNRFDDPVVITNAIFFILLFSLLITLYDRYRQIYLIRYRSF